MTKVRDLSRRSALQIGAALVVTSGLGPTLAATAADPLAGGPGPAGSKTVIELFASQACPKCPPAIEFLGELEKDDRYIVLSMPVDMWDFMGWKDRYARRDHTIRQKAYNKRLRDRSAFTPQMIIDGMEFASGAHRGGVRTAIEKCRKMPMERVGVTLTHQGDQVRIDIDDANAPDGPAAVYLVGYRTRAPRRIRSGANRGKSMGYTNAVFAMDHVADWSGAAMSLTAPIPQTGQGMPDGIAVLVQKDGIGPILGAEKMDFRFRTNPGPQPGRYVEPENG